ncbi:MAG TPA: hypothetical protein VFG90_09615 [Nitrososphaeraceae archaeon]|nr:hypothetical protein [Nitrososphaeraceae archaeon]
MNILLNSAVSSKNKHYSLIQRKIIMIVVVVIMVRIMVMMVLIRKNPLTEASSLSTRLSGNIQK